MFRDVMIDTETLSLRSNAAVLSIGAVEMDLERYRLGREYKVNISIGSNRRINLHIDPDTVAWWNKQSDEAKSAASVDAMPIHGALWGFGQWLTDLKSVGDEVRTWSMGAAFDIPILENAYRACDLPVPWKYKHVMCYRTMYALNRNIKAVYDGVHHDALSDARNQARHLLEIMKYNDRPWWKRIL